MHVSVFHSQSAEGRKRSWFGDNVFNSRIKCICSCVLAHAEDLMMRMLLCLILLVFGGCSLWWCSVCCGGAAGRSGPPGGLPVAHITPSLWARGSARPEETDTCAAGTDTPTDRRDRAPLLTLDKQHHHHHRTVLAAGHIHSVWD